MVDVGQFNIAKADGAMAIKPIWVDNKHVTDEGIIQWVGEYLPILEQIHENRIRKMNVHLCWYLNELNSMNSPRFMLANRQVMPIPLEAVPILVSHLYDLTESRVSKLSLYKASFEVVPTHIDDGDKLSARLLKPCLDSVARINNFDFVIQDAERWTAIFSEVFVGIEWDKNLGDKDEKGTPVGDVSIRIKEPYWVLYEPKRDWRDVTFILEIDEILHIDEARKKFKKPQLQADQNTQIFGFQNSVEGAKELDEIVVYRLIYKPSEYLPDGLVVRIAGNQVVYRADKYPYSHNDFPYERHTDIDVPGRIFPISFYNYLIPMQHAYNKMTALIHRNIALCSHPKWIADKGSVAMQALGNTASIAWVNPGMRQPKLEVYNPVSNDIYTFRNDMRSEMQTISGTQGISRGTPPPGARAASMLRFYEEQETQRQSTKISKHNDLIKRIMTKSGGVIGDYYPNSPERLIRTVGKFNQYNIRRFQQTKLSANYEVLIQNSTGFSETRAGKIEEIGFIQEKVPGALSNEQIADILELSTPQKAYDIITAALKLAEKENQDMMEGIPCAAPQKWEDHFVHWRTHVIFMQTETFKRLPMLFQEEFFAHVKIHEMEMDEMGADPASLAAQMLAGLPNYPIFWKRRTPKPVPIPTGGGAQPSPSPSPVASAENGAGLSMSSSESEVGGGAPPQGAEANTSQDLQPMEA
jgi:hypothetical protein